MTDTTIDTSDIVLEPLRPTATTSAKTGVQATRVYSADRLSIGRLLALSAISPRGSEDPVDRALAASLKVNRPDIALFQVEASDFDPATAERRFSLAKVKAYPFVEGPKDMVVMRGELLAVLEHCQMAREDRLILLKNADLMKMRGRRPLALATALVDADGHVGPFRIQGFVAIGATEGATIAEDMANNPSQWIRVNVWTPLLRWQHWVNVVLIFVMSCTGYYIMDPFFGPAARAGEETGYLMGWIRFIHFTAAFLWLGVGATRLMLFFTSKDRQLRWRSLWPINTRRDLSHLWETVKHYAFVRDEAPVYVGHNPLQQLAYTSVYVACAIQMATGLSLYGLYQQSGWFWWLISMPVHWLGVPTVRLIHAVIMFLLWAFVIMHVYMAIRADSLERHGGVSSMVNGGVWMRRGAKPVDAPKIG